MSVIWFFEAFDRFTRFWVPSARWVIVGYGSLSDGCGDTSWHLSLMTPFRYTISTPWHELCETTFLAPWGIRPDEPCSWHMRKAIYCLPIALLIRVACWLRSSEDCFGFDCNPVLKNKLLCKELKNCIRIYADILNKSWDEKNVVLQDKYVGL